MNAKTWASVDRYYGKLLSTTDPALEAALADADKAGLPCIHVSPNQGKMLHLLARIHGAKRILEIGTLAGYSTINLARALPPRGKLITLEVVEKHAGVAARNIKRAGLSGKVEQRLGRASDLLKKLVEERATPFDFIFIDADKASLPDYFRWAMKLSRVGTVIVVDNVVRQGGVINARSVDASVQGVRKMNDLIAAEPRVTATVIQTVGTKGYDGFILALVTN